jgi:hypothetical protein
MLKKPLFRLLLLCSITVIVGFTTSAFAMFPYPEANLFDALRAGLFCSIAFFMYLFMACSLSASLAASIAVLARLMLLVLLARPKRGFVLACAVEIVVASVNALVGYGILLAGQQ